MVQPRQPGIYITNNTATYRYQYAGVHTKTKFTHTSTTITYQYQLTIGSCLACVYRVMNARGKFGEHEKSVRVARGAAERNSSFLRFFRSKAWPFNVENWLCTEQTWTGKQDHSKSRRTWSRTCEKHEKILFCKNRKINVKILYIYYTRLTISKTRASASRSCLTYHFGFPYHETPWLVLSSLVSCLETPTMKKEALVWNVTHQRNSRSLVGVL